MLNVNEYHTYPDAAHAISKDLDADYSNNESNVSESESESDSEVDTEDEVPSKIKVFHQRLGHLSASSIKHLNCIGILQIPRNHLKKKISCV